MTVCEWLDMVKRETVPRAQASMNAAVDSMTPYERSGIRANMLDAMQREYDDGHREAVRAMAKHHARLSGWDDGVGERFVGGVVQ